MDRLLLSHAPVGQPTENMSAMFDDDLPEALRHASAANLLQCLTMLADEAASLNLPRTMLALRKAIRACKTEQTRPVAPPRMRRSMTLH